MPDRKSEPYPWTYHVLLTRSGNVGFVFTKEDLAEIRDLLLKNKVCDLSNVATRNRIQAMYTLIASTQCVLVVANITCVLLLMQFALSLPRGIKVRLQLTCLEEFWKCDSDGAKGYCWEMCGRQIIG